MPTTDRKTESGSRSSKGQSFLASITESLDVRYQRHLLMFLLALVLTFIIIPKGGFTPGYYNIGDIASRDVKAPRELLIPDEKLTEKKRVEAEEAVLPVYDFDPEAGIGLVNRVQQVLDLSHAELSEGQTPESVRSEIENLLGTSINDSEARLLKLIAANAATSGVRRSGGPRARSNRSRGSPISLRFDAIHPETLVHP